MQKCPISAPGSRTTYLRARLKNALSRGPIQERPISAPGPRTTYLGGRLKNDLSRRPVEERPISAPDTFFFTLLNSVLEQLSGVLVLILFLFLFGAFAFPRSLCFSSLLFTWSLVLRFLGSTRKQAFYFCVVFSWA